MSQEIERKFLVRDDGWRGLGATVSICQGYISAHPQRTVRVRIADQRAWLTIKGISTGASRSEFEYPIPLADARQMLAELCDRPLLEKRRTRIPRGDVAWEVDEFLGENHGLIIAEVELRSPDQVVDFPGWIGAEVTGDERYFNSSLVAHPFQRWEKK